MASKNGYRKLQHLFLLTLLGLVLSIGCSGKHKRGGSNLNSSVCVTVNSKDIMGYRPVDEITTGDLGNRTHKYVTRYLLEKNKPVRQDNSCETYDYKLVVDLLTLEELVDKTRLMGKVKSKTTYKIKFDAILSKEGETLWIKESSSENEKIDEALESIASSIVKDSSGKIKE